MQPEIDLFGLPVKTFGLMFALGFLAAGAVLTRRLKELGKPEDHAYEIVFSALVGGLVGARLIWIVQNPGEVSGDVLGSVFGGSGLVWYGGVLGGAGAVIIWAWRRGELSARLFDLAAPALALGYAIGRVGCQVSGDGDYGQPTDLPWGMPYPDGTVPTTDDVHPTPIYETLAMGTVAYGLWRMRDTTRPGVVFALYLLLSGLERFLVEFIRRNDSVLVGLTTAQIEAAVIALAGLALLAYIGNRSGGLRVGGAAAARPAVA